MSSLYGKNKEQVLGSADPYITYFVSIVLVKNVLAYL